MKKETPIGLALILCDSVIQDKATNKRSLIGLFDRLAASRFPCVHPALSIFVSATSGRGEYDAEVRCRHQESGAVAFSIKGKLRFQDPLQVVEVTFNVQQPRFESEGEYWLEFLLDDIPVMMRRLFLAQHNPNQPPPSQGPNQN